MSTTHPKDLKQFIKHQARICKENHNIAERSNQLKLLNASLNIILYNPLALKPYSWALFVLLHILNEEEALRVLENTIQKHSQSKGFLKLLSLYNSIKGIKRKTYSLQYAEVSIDNSIHYLESDFLYSWGPLQMISGRPHEPNTIQLMRNILKKLGGSAVHAGSWCGDMLPALSKACGKEGKVYTFEPVLKNYILSKQTIASNQLENIHLFNMGLGSSFRSTHVTISDSTGRNLGGRSFIGDQTLNKQKIYGTQELVSIIPLDSINMPGDVSLVHLDIEGSEMCALNGAREFIAKKQPIFLIEVTSHQTKKYDEINQFMDSMNYIPMRGIPSIRVWAPNEAGIPGSIFEGVDDREDFERNFGFAIQKSWLDDYAD